VKSRYLFLLMLLLVSMLDCQAKREPSWMKELPRPGNETYIYVRESGEGATIESAMAQAMVRVFQSTANRLGEPFDVQQVYTALQNGTDYRTISQNYHIPVNRVGVYSTQLKSGEYWVYVLCQVAAMSNVTPVWDRVGLNSGTSNFLASLKSVFIPGWGQMGKSHYGEGIATLVGEAALVGGGIACYKAAQNQLAILRNPTTPINDFTVASHRYDNLQTTSYIAWGVAGALYVFNLIRAYTLQPKGSNEWAFQPSIIATPYSIAPTAGLTLRF